MKTVILDNKLDKIIIAMQCNNPSYWTANYDRDFQPLDYNWRKSLEELRALNLFALSHKIYPDAFFSARAYIHKKKRDP